MSNAILAAQANRAAHEAKAAEHRRMEATVARMNELAHESQNQRQMMSMMVGIQKDNARCLSMLRRMNKQKERECAKARHRAAQAIGGTWFLLAVVTALFYLLVDGDLMDWTVFVGFVSMFVATGIYVTGCCAAVIRWCKY